VPSTTSSSSPRSALFISSYTSFCTCTRTTTCTCTCAECTLCLGRLISTVLLEVILIRTPFSLRRSSQHKRIPV
jgi:hypothetical protein